MSQKIACTELAVQMKGKDLSHPNWDQKFMIYYNVLVLYILNVIILDMYENYY